MSKTCEKCIHYEVCRYPLEYRAFPNTCWKYEEERPHGEWEYVTHYARRFRVCSVCKAEKEDDRATGWNFCQNCGSDNRKRSEAE